MFAQRNDLLFEVTNTTTFPGYGYFLEQVYNCFRVSNFPFLISSFSLLLKGFTSWPEDWNTKQENGYLSKMHGCYNGIGLWFIEGLAGIVVDASSDPPISFRAAVEAGDITWANGTRYTCCFLLFRCDSSVSSYLVTRLLNYSFALAGQAFSSWSAGATGFVHNVTVPNLSVLIVCLYRGRSSVYV